MKRPALTQHATPAGNRDVRIERDDGQVIDTKANEQGVTESLRSDVMHQVSITQRPPKAGGKS